MRRQIDCVGQQLALERQKFALERQKCEGLQALQAVIESRKREELQAQQEQCLWQREERAQLARMREWQVCGCVHISTCPHTRTNPPTQPSTHSPYAYSIYAGEEGGIGGSGERGVCMMHRAWGMGHGARCMVHGTWCMVHGTWCRYSLFSLHTRLRLRERLSRHSYGQRRASGKESGRCIAVYQFSEFRVHPLTTCYLLLNTCYLLRTTYYLLIATYWLLLTTYYLLATCYVLLTTYYLLLATCYLLLTTYYLVFTTYSLLLTTYYLLLTG